MKKIIILICLLFIIFCGAAIILINYNKNIINEEDSNVTINKKENVFEIKDVKQNDFDNNYKIEKQLEIITKNYFKIDMQNDDLVISLIESNENKELLQGKKAIYNQKYIISNVKAKDVEHIFYGNEGQDIMYPLIYLLQKDGTVKGIDTEYGYKTGEFIAEDILGLNNVEKIEQTSVTPPNDSGYEAVIAITKDQKVYEIHKK